MTKKETIIQETINTYNNLLPMIEKTKNCNYVYYHLNDRKPNLIINTETNEANCYLHDFYSEHIKESSLAPNLIDKTYFEFNDAVFCWKNPKTKEMPKSSITKTEPTNDETETTSIQNQIQTFFNNRNPKTAITLTILPQNKNSKYADKLNYQLEKDILFVPKNQLEYTKSLQQQLNDQNFLSSTLRSSTNNQAFSSSIKNQSSTNQQTLKSLPNFQIKYRNPDKLRISQLLAKIQLDKLATLKIHEITTTKPDKYGNLPKTNYKKSLNILYYQPSDLQHLKQFLVEATSGYRIRNLSAGYQVRFNNKKNQINQRNKPKENQK